MPVFGYIFNRKVYEFDTNDDNILGLLCSLYAKIGDYENAIEFCNKALKRNPKDFETYGIRGSINGLKNNLPCAKHDFTMAIYYGKKNHNQFVSFYEKNLEEINIQLENLFLDAKKANNNILLKGSNWIKPKGGIFDPVAFIIKFIDNERYVENMDEEEIEKGTYELRDNIIKFDVLNKSPHYGNFYGDHIISGDTKFIKINFDPSILDALMEMRGD